MLVQVQALVLQLVLEQGLAQPPVPKQVQEPAQVESPGPERLRAARKRLHSWVPPASSSCNRRLAVPPTR